MPNQCIQLCFTLCQISVFNCVLRLFISIHVSDTILVPSHNTGTGPQYWYQGTILVPGHNTDTGPQYRYQATILVLGHNTGIRPQYWYRATILVPGHNTGTGLSGIELWVFLHRIMPSQVDFVLSLELIF